VRVLLDEQLPRRLARQLTGHDVRTVQQQGWAGVKNGELLQHAADAGFEVFLTADQNLQYQQNLARARLGVVVLVAHSNKLEDLIPLIAPAMEAISRSRAGEIIRIEG
jgi:predicted nuclease of predicted toxin-antitoxin system